MAEWAKSLQAGCSKTFRRAWVEAVTAADGCTCRLTCSTAINVHPLTWWLDWCSLVWKWPMTPIPMLQMVFLFSSHKMWVRAKYSGWLIRWYAGLLWEYQCDISLIRIVSWPHISVSSIIRAPVSHVIYLCLWEQVACVTNTELFTCLCVCLWGGGDISVHWSVSKVEVGRFSLVRYLACTFPSLTCHLT